MHITQISLIFVSLCAGAAFAVVASAPVVADSAASQAFVAKALAAGRCWAVDTEVDKDGALLSGAPDAPLAPGRYRLHVLLSRAPLGDRFSNAVEVTIKVGDVAQRVNPLRYALPNEFIHMPVDFSVKPGDRDTGFAINWRVSPEAKKLHKTGGAAMVEAGPDDDNLIPDVIVNRPKTANDGTISVRDLPALPYNLAVSGVHIERLCPVRTTVRADKVVYKPGETGTATVTLTNTGNTPATVTLTVEVLAGLDGKKPVATQKLEIPAAGEKTWSGPFFTVGMRWGAEVRATVTADDERADDARAVFAVSHNPYEVAMFAAQGPNLGLGWKDRRRRAACAGMARSRLHRRGTLLLGAVRFRRFYPAYRRLLQRADTVYALGERHEESAGRPA